MYERANVVHMAMSAAGGAGGLRVHVERVVPAARPRVFAAHVAPDQLAQWWGPDGFTIPALELDLRVGGQYRIAMEPPQGEVFFLSGEFREVDPPARLVYTFRWEPPDPDDQETIVTFSLDDRGEATNVIVDQGVFATEARRALHEQGWRETLDHLERVMRG
jgi:uncharacterized protein YndB with AHSA1/START domain